MHYNQSFYNSTHNTASNEGLLNALCIFSAVTVLVNSIILLASKYTTAGKSAVLVFMRSLCVGDLLIGAYGIFKTILLNNLSERQINCFLPDSIFISASTTISLTLLWLNIDTYLRLAKPFGYGNSMDKGSVIIAMMMVWNGGFIIGFLPQLGWNINEYCCNFFMFYTVPYIVIVSLIWIFCITCGFVFQLCVKRILIQLQNNTDFMLTNSLQYNVYSQLVQTIKNDMILFITCYFSFIIYIGIFFIKNDEEDKERANSNLIYFLPIFLFKAFIGAFIHSYRTIQLQSLTPEGRKNNVKTLRKLLSLKTTKPKHNKPMIFCTQNSVRHDKEGNQTFPLTKKKIQQSVSNTTVSTIIERSPHTLNRTSSSSVSSSSNHTTTNSVSTSSTKSTDTRAFRETSPNATTPV